MHSATQKIYLARCEGYEPQLLSRAVGEALQAIGFHPAGGSRVLVKPNLLWADPTGLSCTHPKVVRAACLYLMDHGCKISVSDSPCFGKASRVAREIGLKEALSGLPAPIVEMDEPVSRPLSLGGKVSISLRALEADCILNLPKLKAHRMMRLSGAVKNLYGCITGVRKAVMHARHGDKTRGGVPAFPALVVDVFESLPPSVALLDGITGMHKTGPMKGEAYQASLVAAASSSPALDTMLYTLLGLAPTDLPLWAELQRRNTLGAFTQELDWLGDLEAGRSLEGFELPATLNPQSFNPLSLMRSSVKRLLESLKG